MGDSWPADSPDWTASFGYWVKRRRLALDLTQAALAHKVGCSTSMVKKVERDERRPSRQMAELLATCLAVPDGEREMFIAMALGERATADAAIASVPVFAGDRPPPEWLEGAYGQAVPTARFVGREAELAWLETHFREMQAGRGRVVFVAGGAGRGKTALLQAFAREATGASGDLAFASGSCTALTGMGQPYMPFLELVTTLSGDLEGLWRQGWISGQQARTQWAFATEALNALAGQAPDLVGALLPGLTPGRGASPGSSRKPRGADAAGAPGFTTPRPSSERIIGQFTDYLQALARHTPLLLVLDDLQWIDDASLNLLFHLGRRISRDNILILGAFRPDDFPADRGQAAQARSLISLVDELGLLYEDNLLDLGKSDPDEERRLSDALIDREPNLLTEPFRSALFSRTKGHPLFTIELLKEMQARGDLVLDPQGSWVEGPEVNWNALPRRTQVVINRRLERLPAEERQLLEVACVEGEVFTVELVARILNLDELDVHQRLRRSIQDQLHLAREAGLVAGAERKLARYRFHHVLFQQYLYETLGEGERRRRHNQVGEAIKELYGVDYPGAPVQLAYHFEAAGQSQMAVDYALMAGDRARLVYAHQEAIAHYQSALRQLEELGESEAVARVLMKLGLTHQIAFEFDQAQQAFDRAFAIWKRPRPAGEAGPVARREPGPLETAGSKIRQLRLIWRDPPSIDPTMGGYSMTAPIAMQLFSGLVAFGTESEILPDVAERWDIEDGGRRYVFHLRADVVWSDGAPVTAHDFAFTYRRGLNPETKAIVAGQLLYAVRGARGFHLGETDDPIGIGIHAPNERTLVFELEEPTSYFIHNLAYYVMLPVPRHLVSARPHDWTRPEHIVSNGPFLLSVWEPGEIMILERNPRYHGDFSGNLEQVRLLTNAPPASQSELYASGAIDVAMDWFVPGYQMDTLVQQFPQEYQKRAQFATLYYFIDPIGPHFGDKRLRQALAMALDREALSRAIKRRYARPAYGGFVPPGMPGHVPDCSLPFDPERARDLLAQAGFPEGKNIPETQLVSYPHWAVATRFMQESWRKHLGLNIETQVVLSSSELINLEGSIGIGGWLADYPDPDNFLRVDVDLTIPHWRNETYQDLLARASKLTDQNERLALYKQAEHILADEACLVPFMYNNLHLMLKPWIKRYPTAAVKNFGFWKDVIITDRRDNLE